MTQKILMNNDFYEKKYRLLRFARNDKLFTRLIDTLGKGKQE